MREKYENKYLDIEYICSRILQIFIAFISHKSKTKQLYEKNWYMQSWILFDINEILYKQKCCKYRCDIISFQQVICKLLYTRWKETVFKWVYLSLFWKLSSNILRNKVLLKLFFY